MGELCAKDTKVNYDLVQDQENVFWSIELFLLQKLEFGLTENLR